LYKYSFIKRFNKSKKKLKKMKPILLSSLDLKECENEVKKVKKNLKLFIVKSHGEKL